MGKTVVALGSSGTVSRVRFLALARLLHAQRQWTLGSSMGRPYRQVHHLRKQDYWWQARSSMRRFRQAQCLSTSANLPNPVAVGWKSHLRSSTGTGSPLRVTAPHRPVGPVAVVESWVSAGW